MSAASYLSPVNQLLTYGDCCDFDLHNWPNYLVLGITNEHIPELVRMATDSQLYEASTDSPECWSPIHAWRTLGQLRAEAAIEPLISLFSKRDEDDNDVWEWIAEELPIVFGMIGSSAIPALTTHLTDTSRGVFSRATAVSSLTNIALKDSNFRTHCTTILTQQLEFFQVQAPEFNSFIIAALIDLEAVESASVMEQAFEADCVDEMITGDWNSVQMELGLKTEAPVLNQASNFEPTENLAGYYKEFPSDSSSGFAVNRTANAKRQAKRKIQKVSRKKNRKKNK
ncbi:DUF1186 domain-containing protein [Fortiea sp. LEGE XX443]|uniref:HEAT repeat domain-containing protein n=1 Tax=Fortiea sp. LEGE XX443 TaxID=1828611 RepID=UPI001880DC39|nr:DUF1186 domain-containing protein [Fortiea sp. LEGE XX443]MBE9008537.1 DUF1186 domain-containing protein [Fortiea sp. LEGE XX443]